MTVIERIKPEILNVPTEGRKHHAHVDPWSGNSANVFLALVNYAKNGGGGFIKVIDVEEVAVIVEVVILGLTIFGDGKATPMVLDREVGSIFNCGSKLPLRPICIIIDLPCFQFIKLQYSFSSWSLLLPQSSAHLNL